MMRAIKGHIIPVSGQPIEDGIVLFEAGKIVSVGRADAVELPEGVEPIEYEGAVITPGLVDAHTHAGLWAEWYGDAESDGNEGGDPVTAEVRAIDAVWPEHTAFADARSGGVTTLQTTPGSGNCIGGEMLCLKTAPASTVEQMIVKCPTGMKAALGENPKRFYGQMYKKAPMTRMGSASIIRKTLFKAREYMEKLRRAENEPEKAPDTDLGLLALGRVLCGEMPLRIHAHRADDIITAVRISEEFGIQYSIEHCTDGAVVADFLGKRGARVNLGPTFGGKSKLETGSLSFKTAGILANAGCRVSIITDHPFVATQYLISCAALSCAEGLDEAEALRAVTLTAAETIGVHDRVGSLEPGKDADIVVWSGHPFKIRTKVLKVFIDGKAM